MTGSKLRATRWLSAVCFSAMVGLAVFFFLRTKWRAEETNRAVAASKAAKPGKKKSAANAKVRDIALASATVDIDPNISKKPVARRRVVTPVEALAVAPGFRVELVRSAERDEGSWICITKDHRGRLIISGQPGQGMFRATLANGKIEKWERLEMPLSGAMGALYAYESLYLTAEGKDGYGIYRCRDTNGDDQYDEFEQLANFQDVADQGTREHGPHGLALGPDGKIYCVIGNRTAVIEKISSQSPHRNHEDDILPEVARRPSERVRIKGHYPGGHILRFDAEGKEWELVAGGLRNSYDLAFNGDGECFTFDNDTEADWGMPWYRPARLNHCVSGAEFGTRPDFGTWPAYFEDAVPPIGEVGLAAPTGIESGRGTKFPAKYQRAIFLLDWANGRILTADFQPDGATYSADWEDFVSVNRNIAVELPLNVTDLTVGPDGSLYFVVGGRNAIGALYRVVYTGNESTEQVSLTNEEGAAARKVRQNLERFHGHSEDGAVREIWPHLGSADRLLRYAARVALESQPLSEWQERALAETESLAKLNALLALTRVAPESDQPAVQQSLADFPLDDVDNEQKLIFLRVCGVSLSRHLAQASTEFRSQLIAKVEPLVPTPDEALNREAMRMLIFLEAPSAVAKGLALIEDAKSLQDQMFYLVRIRQLGPRHWTVDQRRTYLKFFGKDRPILPSEPQLAGWFREVDREFTEGGSFFETITTLYWDYVQKIPPRQREQLEPVIEEVSQSIMPQFSTPAGLARARTWTIEDLLPLLDRVDENRNFERGRNAFINAQCIKCHRCGTAGGSRGPDLTTIARRFNREQIMQSIVLPSNVISDQYASTVVATKDGRVIVGRIIEETSETIVLQTDPLVTERMEIPTDDIEHRRVSKVSSMPEHLIDVLHEDEVLDLIAYLESGGSKSYAAFQRSSAAQAE